MADLTTLANAYDDKKGTCAVVIETPKGSRNKFAYDPASNLFKLSGLLPEGMVFPFDFGFVPSTLGDDGDPVDVLVLMDEPTHVGCLVDVRILGVIAAQQIQDGKKEENDRLLAAAIHSYQHENLETIEDVSQTLLAQVEAFFVSYNRQRGKQFKIAAMHGPRKALKLLKAGMRTYRKKKG
jgi:inorganic pyrophosphatase